MPAWNRDWHNSRGWKLRDTAITKESNNAPPFGARSGAVAGPRVADLRLSGGGRTSGHALIESVSPLLLRYFLVQASNRRYADDLAGYVDAFSQGASHI